jgi:hypothetical protein
MNYKAIKNHLKSYSIYAKRKTTINHAFASAIAPSDKFDEIKIKEAITSIGQNPEEELKCVYCNAPANTWDHIVAVVKNSQFSGYGHRIANLLPCCKPCNAQKGNKTWENFIEKLNIPDESKKGAIKRIKNYIEKYQIMEEPKKSSPEYQEYEKIKEQIFDLMKQADAIAEKIRQKLT